MTHSHKQMKRILAFSFIKFGGISLHVPYLACPTRTGGSQTTKLVRIYEPLKKFGLFSEIRWLGDVTSRTFQSDSKLVTVVTIRLFGEVNLFFSCDVPALPPILDGIAGPESEIQSVVEASRIHSRRFREYCDQVIDKQIDELAAFILSELNRFYQRQLQKNQIKAKNKRRFVLGIREVFKHLKLGKIKCVVVSPNLEKIQSKGSDLNFRKSKSF